MPLPLAGAIIGGSILSGILGSQAAGKAASASQAASQAATAEQRRQFDITQQNLAPYQYYGRNALAQLGSQFGIPAYQPQVQNTLAQTQQPMVDNSAEIQQLQDRLQYVPRNNLTLRNNINNQIQELQAQQQTPAQSAAQPLAQPQTRQMAPAGQVSPANVLAQPMNPPGPQNQEANLPSFDYSGQVPADFQFNITQDPGYQFAQQQAMQAATRQAAAHRGLRSGNILAELQNRATGLASQYANDIYNRQLGQYNVNRQNESTRYGRALGEYGLGYQRAQDIYGRGQQRLNRLSSLAGVGQSAVGQLGQAGQGMAGNIGNILMSNAANQANAAGTRYGAINQAVQGGLSNYLLSNAIQPQQQYSNYGPYSTGYAWG